MVDLGHRLAELRNLHRMSQEDVATAVHVSRQAVSKWETGRAVPDTAILIALADVYDVSLDELVGRQPAEPDAGPPSGLVPEPGQQYVPGSASPGQYGSGSTTSGQYVPGPTGSEQYSSSPTNPGQYVPGPTTAGQYGPTAQSFGAGQSDPYNLGPGQPGTQYGPAEPPFGPESGGPPYASQPGYGTAYSPYAAGQMSNAANVPGPGRQRRTRLNRIFGVLNSLVILIYFVCGWAFGWTYTWVIWLLLPVLWGIRGIVASSDKYQ